MTAGMSLAEMWQQAPAWQLTAALVCGAAVGFAYFRSLQWSLGRLNATQHKFRLFAGVALLRILLFFGVLVLIAGHNAVVVLFYVAAFFVVKTFIMMREKSKIFQQTEVVENEHD